MNCDKKDMLLYAVTDRSWLKGESLYSQVEKALKGGVTMVQLREKELSQEEFLKEAREIKALCRKYQVPFLINDNVEIALAVDADGVHVGQSDMEANAVREKLGPDKIIGVTAKTVEQAQRAEKAGADYLGSGAIFGTATKQDAKKMEPETLRAICESVSIPVVAIGGITKENALRLRDCRLAGAAVVSGIFAQPDIEKTTRELKEIMKTVVGE